MKILLYGPPGAGKDTQGGLLAEHFGVPILSAGELCREEVSKGTELGEYIAPYLSTGGVAPGAATVLIREAIVQKGLGTYGYVMNGYPRRPDILRDLLTWEQPTHVLHLVVADDVVRQRLAARGRHDDFAAAIDRRLAHYHENEAAVCRLVQRERLIPYLEIDASATVDEVQQNILHQLL